MSLYRRNPKRDSNEKAVVDALRHVGAKVARISAPGMPDLIVWYQGRITLLEVKRPKAAGQAAGRPTIAQDATFAEGWPVTTVQTVEQALAALGLSC